MRIFKFGGASVKDAQSIRNLLSIIGKYQDEKLLVVVSAMGKTTNHLEKLAASFYKGDGLSDTLYDDIVKFHQQAAIELLQEIPEVLQQLFEKLRSDLEDRNIPYDEYYDQIVPFGELMSTRLIAEFLGNALPVKWMDATKLIATDHSFRNAKVNWDETGARIQQISITDRIVITQGFIGGTYGFRRTTLGREGSDYTAAIFARCMKADQVVFWKDVPGIMNADPKLYPRVRKFDQLSYREVTEMTYYGAKVIHPKTIKPLAQGGIPLLVRSFQDPSLEGTEISNDERGMVHPTFVFRYDQTLVTFKSRSNEFMTEKVLTSLLTKLDQMQVQINIMQISALTFSFCVDDDSRKIEELHDAFEETFEVYHNSGLRLATVKNYSQESLDLLPVYSEKLLEQITRYNYQRLYRP